MQNPADPIYLIVQTAAILLELGGALFAARLVAASPRLHVIFMSGFVDDGDLLAGLNDRATPFLQKPFDIEELARVVNAEAQPR